MPSRLPAGRDLASAAGLAVLAAVYLAANRHYPLDSLAAPGPGVFPLAVGLAMLGIAGWQGARALRSKPDAPFPQKSGETSGTSLRHPLAMMGLLVAYAAAVGLLGFLAASGLLVVVASRLLGARGWLRPVALALGVTAAAYVIFVGWLGVPLPAGVLR